jgi:hypothetical protein
LAIRLSASPAKLGDLKFEAGASLLFAVQDAISNDVYGLKIVPAIKD